MELSTFTAHVEAIKSVYERALGGELVLIDEIGGGTEPQEASALAMGIIDAFVEKGCKVMVTTHLNLLKAYGASQPFALNAATDFDSRTMKPLYRLVYGAAGVSNALKVAQMSGMPQEIIDKSANYLGKQEYVLNDLVRGLETETKAAQEEKRKAAAYREEMHKRLETIRAKRDEYIARAEERCREKVAALEAQIDEITKEDGEKRPGIAPGRQGEGGGLEIDGHTGEKGRPPPGRDTRRRLRQGSHYRERRLCCPDRRPEGDGGDRHRQYADADQEGLCRSDRPPGRRTRRRR